MPEDVIQTIALLCRRAIDHEQRQRSQSAQTFWQPKQMLRWRQSKADWSALPILAQIADNGGSEPKFWMLHIARMGVNRLPLTVTQTIWDVIARVLRTPLAPIMIKRV